ncbi:immunogenic protein precursor [Paraburkholderia ginsengiterrae]|uniref:Immunogenic protein n=1 Tax=Paraburkholderia ginsengiterrae TaxID=1462993 RepID=A0A1A9NA18_9BURK|nr:TAXI family TRAP transporter solute-binding subunit [Paraburkholderia ginsengiterrae]OAJ62453.1 immunogenic protein precursor [Paraburkholderia ginsengiterrae]OAJ62580.1 immunogenic protein precursor [Paraburkholderia ginsengiterrae]
MNDLSTKISLGTATPGGGFPLYGDAAAAAINETDASLLVQTRNTAGSTENIRLLEADELDLALVAGEPAYEAFAGIGRSASNLKIIAAIYSSPGMFAVRGDSTARCVRDLVGKPIAWGTRASGITLLGKYVMDGLGLDREQDFEPHFLDKAADGPVMLAEGKVAAQWGAGIGWPGFTAITNGGGRLIGLAADEIEQIRARHNFLKPIVVPAGSYAGQAEPIQAVGSWSYILGRISLDEELAYRFAKALDFAHARLVQRVAQGAETRPENTLAASPNLQRIHPGVLRYLADKDVDNIV